MLLENYCLSCAFESFVKGIDKIDIPDGEKEKHIRDFLNYLSGIDYNISPPVIGKRLYAELRRISGNEDPFREIKRKSNDMIIANFDGLSDHIYYSEDPFKMALKLTIAGNLIDFATRDSVSLEEIISSANERYIDEEKIEEFRAEVKSSKSILYIGDNAGEIVFDKLFIKCIGRYFDPKQIVYAVRGGPVINDATMTDAEYVGMEKIVKVIDTGDNTPGVDLGHSSEVFIEAYNNSDLIISKGQGNFECLSDSDKNIFFLLITKCLPVSGHLGVNKGSLIVTRA